MLPDYDLDPTIDQDLVDEAHAATPATYTDISCQDLIDELGAGQTRPASPAEAIANARRLATDVTYVGVGYCLRTVRGPEFEILPLYPDAETAWEEADLKHPETDPLKIPRGAIVFWTNGRYGHVALSVGGGMCWTTDYRRSGFVGLAPIAALGPWCGGRLVGWAEDLNGVDCWPTPDKPKPKPVFNIDDRIRLVRNALERARKNDAPKQRRDGLKQWLAQLEARAEKR